MTLRDGIQHALAELAGREAEVRQTLDHLEDAQLRELGNRLSILLRQLGAVIAESDGYQTHPWDDLEAELAEQNVLHDDGEEHHGD